MNAPEPIPFKPDWPVPDMRYLRSELPEPPSLPLEDVFSPRWSSWIRAAAEAKAAPPDYVMAGALSVCGALIGNSRWPSPWQGWTEPPVLWAVAIGNPSMNKSPGLDAVLNPLKKVERALREQVQGEVTEWRARAEVAKLAESAWKEAVKAAIKSGDAVPSRPASANAGKEPIMPRLAVTDTTVEKLAVIASVQPRGALLARDELAGWLQGMSRYSGGGSDRPFWLEAYGGRSYSVERMGRDPVYVDRLSVGVLGGIQPDRLRSLLMKTDDDGLLARFLPVWPNPAPVKRPDLSYDESFMENIIHRLLSLHMHTDDNGNVRPWIISFSEDSRVLLDSFRETARGWESGAEGLLLSFIGKLAGLAVRLSLVLGLMEWASGEAEEPQEIAVHHFGRAAHLVESYLLPMARRAYADASAPKAERAARRLVKLIQEKEWRQFASREVLRSGQVGLTNSDDLNPALNALLEADIIRTVSTSIGSQGGRAQRLFTVNPAVFRGHHDKVA